MNWNKAISDCRAFCGVVFLPKVFHGFNKAQYEVAEMIQNIAIDMGVSPQGVLCSALDLRPSIVAKREDYHLYDKEYWPFMLLCAVVI